MIRKVTNKKPLAIPLSGISQKMTIRKQYTIHQKPIKMTAIKPDFSEIINIEGFKLWDAGEGKRWTLFPSGSPVKNQHARYMLRTANKTYAGSTIDSVIISAFRDGQVDLHKHGYDTCGRCSGSGKLSHYSHINNGTCFNCNGYGVK